MYLLYKVYNLLNIHVGPYYCVDGSEINKRVGINKGV